MSRFITVVDYRQRVAEYESGLLTFLQKHWVDRVDSKQSLIRSYESSGSAVAGQVVYCKKNDMFYVAKPSVAVHWTVSPDSWDGYRHWDTVTTEFIQRYHNESSHHQTQFRRPPPPPQQWFHNIQKGSIATRIFNYTICNRYKRGQVVHFGERFYRYDHPTDFTTVLDPQHPFAQEYWKEVAPDQIWVSLDPLFNIPQLNRVIVDELFQHAAYALVDLPPPIVQLIHGMAFDGTTLEIGSTLAQCRYGDAIHEMAFDGTTLEIGSTVAQCRYGDAVTTLAAYIGAAPKSILEPLIGCRWLGGNAKCQGDGQRLQLWAKQRHQEGYSCFVCGDGLSNASDLQRCVLLWQWHARERHDFREQHGTFVDPMAIHYDKSGLLIHRSCLSRLSSSLMADYDTHRRESRMDALQANIRLSENPSEVKRDSMEWCTLFAEHDNRIQCHAARSKLSFLISSTDNVCIVVNGQHIPPVPVQSHRRRRYSSSSDDDEDRVNSEPITIFQHPNREDPSARWASDMDCRGAEATGGGYDLSDTFPQQQQTMRLKPWLAVERNDPYSYRGMLYSVVKEYLPLDELAWIVIDLVWTVPNPVRSMTLSGTSGSMKHAGQLGAVGRDATDAIPDGKVACMMVEEEEVVAGIELGEDGMRMAVCIDGQPFIVPASPNDDAGALNWPPLPPPTRQDNTSVNVLARLKTRAEQFVQRPVHKCVVTAAAAQNSDGIREVIASTFRHAGWHVLRFIRASTAGIFACRIFDELLNESLMQDGPHYILLVNLENGAPSGHGLHQLDWSLVEMNDGVCDELVQGSGPLPPFLPAVFSGKEISHVWMTGVGAESGNPWVYVLAWCFAALFPSAHLSFPLLGSPTVVYGLVQHARILAHQTHDRIHEMV